MTRTVRDAALMLSALARWDRRDPFCLPDERRDWRDGIEDGVAGHADRRPAPARINAPVDVDGIAAVEKAAHILAQAGAEIEEAEPDLPDCGALFLKLWSTALKLVVANTPEDRRPLLDAGLASCAPPCRIIPATEETRTPSPTQNEAATRWPGCISDLDLVLCPTRGGPRPSRTRQRRTRLPLFARSLGSLDLPVSTLTRQPAISLPMGAGANGLPGQRAARRRALSR